VNDRELAQRLGTILNCIGRIEGRTQAMHDYIEEEIEHPFGKRFMDGLQRDVADVQLAAEACLNAISGPLKLALPTDDGDDGDDGDDREPWDDEDWGNVQDV
jgi:hypothetical protein